MFCAICLSLRGPYTQLNGILSIEIFRFHQNHSISNNAFNASLYLA